MPGGGHAELPELPRHDGRVREQTPLVRHDGGGAQNNLDAPGEYPTKCPRPLDVGDQACTRAYRLEQSPCDVCVLGAPTFLLREVFVPAALERSCDANEKLRERKRLERQKCERCYPRPVREVFLCLILELLVRWIVWGARCDRDQRVERALFVFKRASAWSA